ncbi:SMP-30/gluconolactonase/LRE family protein [Aurantibacter crassamenti]|uniref:SMP-30/gluconolactonase/LRE family protein n=1 Tax=Aurantibacter crassamenti TaxID=1837375 RepID=UPI00193AB066|nr:SMP-30/gluconolactonase/LRE family protein [Aurantibacter crassamenti]MBM1105193.1 SMP-30/gluconolactonase/LRE family protein [Aurantibacter crassamenti]
MNYLIKIPISFLFLSIVISCKAQSIQSSDFTPEFSFTKGIEGPAVDANGNLYAVNFQEEGTIGIVDSKGVGSIFANLPEGSVGNGIRFDKSGNMFIADYKGHNVLYVKKGSKEVSVWAHNAEMSQPNDLAMAPNGTIYLSDPNWAESTGRIWMVNASKEIILLEENMGTVNGIEVSPDGKKLYANESVQLKIWEYDINADGTISNKQEFMSFNDFGMDGMRCDSQGNLYITRYGKGTVLIVSSAKKILKEVQLKGKKPSNITFGGSDGKTCYVTMADRGCFESFDALNSGAFYNRIH